MTFTGDDNAAATFLLHVMGAFAEFERSLIRERQREGIALAKQRKVYTGRIPALTEAKVTELRRRAAEGVPKTVLAKQFGISRATVYAYLRTDDELELAHVLAKLPADDRPSPALEKYDVLLPARTIPSKPAS